MKLPGNTAKAGLFNLVSGKADVVYPSQKDETLNSDTAKVGDCV